PIADLRCIRALSPIPVRTACLMHASLITGSMPGMAASTSDTCELGAPPKAVEAPENSLDCEVTWAWISMPMTTSQSPVAPLISFDLPPARFIHDFRQSMVPHRHKAAAFRPGGAVGTPTPGGRWSGA